jgi:hypothetical protein
MSNAMQKFKSPKGTLEWVTISGEGKENLSGKLKYQADVVLDPKNNGVHQAAIDAIDAFWAENKPKGYRKKAKSLGYYLHDVEKDADGEPVFNEDGEKVFDPDGKVALKFSTDTVFAKSGDAKVIKIYNAKANVVSLGDKTIGNGSEGYISGMMAIYKNENKGVLVDAGVTLYLNAIQLTKFVAYEGADAGFEADEDEGGFTGVDEDADFESVESDTPKKVKL